MFIGEGLGENKGRGKEDTCIDKRVSTQFFGLVIYSRTQRPSAAACKASFDHPFECRDDFSASRKVVVWFGVFKETEEENKNLSLYYVV